MRTTTRRLAFLSPWVHETASGEGKSPYKEALCLNLSNLYLSLAYAEMRLIMTRLLWNFDIEIGPDIGTWIQQNKNWTLWEKPPLPVLLKPVR